MTAAYSLDLRERALARKEAGETNREIAAALRISPSCVSKWAKRKRETGSLTSAQTGGYKPRTLSGERPTGCARASPPGRSPRLVGRVGRTGDQDASAGGMGVRSRRGPELQKNAAGREQPRPDVARKRARWKAHQGRIAPSRLLVIDETPGSSPGAGSG